MKLKTILLDLPSERMKILSLNFEKSWRGGERQTLLNAIGLIEKGFIVHLVCRKGSVLEKKALEQKLKVYSLGSTVSVLFFLIINARKYDALHAQGSKILTYCILSKPFHNTKIIFTRRINFKPKGKLTRIKYRLCDRIVAISSSVRNIVAEFSSRNDIELISDVVVESPLDEFAINNRLKEINPNNKKIIATIAALTSEKNPLDTVETVRLLKEKRDDFIFLHFGEGVMKPEMMAKIEKYNLQQTYLMMGFVDNVNDYFLSMDVFVITSSNEGLCSSVLDAFVYKVPVVSTTAGGLLDLIVDERGIACETNNPSMIADGVDYILNNPNLAQRIKESAYKYVLEKHSLEQISEQYGNLIHELCNSKKNI